MFTGSRGCCDVSRCFSVVRVWFGQVWFLSVMGKCHSYLQMNLFSVLRMFERLMLGLIEVNFALIHLEVWDQIIHKSTK